MNLSLLFVFFSSELKYEIECRSLKKLKFGIIKTLHVLSGTYKFKRREQDCPLKQTLCVLAQNLAISQDCYMYRKFNKRAAHFNVS